VKLKVYPNAAEFLAGAEASLMRDEEENNLILGVARRVKDGTSYGQAAPYFLTVDADGEIVAAAIRTPPFPLVLCGMGKRLEAVEVLVEHVSTADPRLPGVNGAVRFASAFAEIWGQRMCVRTQIERRMRIYVVREVLSPLGVPGRIRLAEDEDVETLAEWVRAFQVEAVPNDPPVDPRATVLRLLSSGLLVVWDDNGPVSMAGSSRSSSNGASVSVVYTPPEHRGKGYASACVAGLSQLLLDRGYTFCTLYTDLSNPTSNKIYQRIGYRAVTDWAAYRFEPVNGTAD